MRCAIYARYSSDKQNPRSIEDQIKKCRRHAKDQGWTILDEHIYSDEAISGARADRRGYQQLLRVIERSNKENLIDGVLVEDQSRLWRDNEEQSRVLKLMKFTGVRLLGCDGTDSASPSAALYLGVRGLINEEARKEIGRRTIRGLRGNAEEGLHTGGRCFGYQNIPLEKGTTNSKKNPTKLVVNAEEAPVIVRIFEMCADGYSLKKTAKTLNAEGIQSPRPQTGRLQRSWCPSTIRVFLHNERYHGFVTFGKSKREEHYLTEKRVKRPGVVTEMIRKEFPDQRIVSEDLWQKVQDRIAQKKRAYADSGRRVGLAPVGRSIGNPYLFSGLLKCADCGANITLVAGRGKNHEEAYYGCPFNVGRGTCKNNVKIRKDALETQLLALIQSEVLREDCVEYTISRFEEELTKALRSTDSQMDRLAEKKRKIEIELKNLTQAVATGLDSSSIREEIGDRERQIREISRKVLAAEPGTIKTQIKDLRKMVEASLADVRGLMNSDPVSAKAVLARHMPKIVLKPGVKPDGKKFYQVLSEWELLEGGVAGYAQSDGAEGEKCTMCAIPVEMDLSLLALVA